MSQFNDTGYGSVTLSGSVSQYERVTGAGAQAGAAAQDIGCVLQDGVSGDVVGVSLVSKQGSQKMIASGAISEGAAVYNAASGRVASSGTNFRGVALEAATAAGDVIEVMPAMVDVA